MEAYLLLRTRETDKKIIGNQALYIYIYIYMYLKEGELSFLPPPGVDSTCLLLLLAHGGDDVVTDVY